MNYRELQRQLNQLKDKNIIPKKYSLKQPKEVLQKKYNSFKNNYFKISLQRGEGKHDELFDKNGDRIPATVVYTWKEANETLKQWATTVVGHSDKIDFTVEWIDYSFVGSFELTKTHRIGVDFCRYVWAETSYMSGKRCPQDMTEGDYQQLIKFYALTEQDRKAYDTMAIRTAVYMISPAKL